MDKEKICRCKLLQFKNSKMRTEIYLYDLVYVHKINGIIFISLC